MTNPVQSCSTLIHAKNTIFISYFSLKFSQSFKTNDRNDAEEVISHVNFLDTQIFLMNFPTVVPFQNFDNCRLAKCPIEHIYFILAKKIKSEEKTRDKKLINLPIKPCQLIKILCDN